MTVLRQLRPVMAANRKLGCLSIFLFVALCASLFVNLVLTVAAFQRLGGIREAEPIPRFREILLQREARATTDKIAVITMRGLISSSLPGAVTDSMVDDMRAALQQARDDSRVKAIVLEVDSPGGEVTASDAIYSALVKLRARKPVVVYMDSLAASGGYYVSCGGKFLNAQLRAVVQQGWTRLRGFQKRQVQGHVERRATDHTGGTRAGAEFYHENLR